MRANIGERWLNQMSVGKQQSRVIANYWAVVPAAGVGKRMQADRPKQYLMLQGRTVLEQTLIRLDAIGSLKGIVVAINEEDQYWPDLNIRLRHPLLQAIGGVERSHSVLNALMHLSEQAEDEDWVLVHDAARPCVRLEDIHALMEQLANDPLGGLLAVPVRDTMKRSNVLNSVTSTVDRSGLWHALTPQMFRLGALRAALEQAMEDGVLVTDESSALEYIGKSPRLVEAHSDNIKITRPEDLALAEFYLQQQGAG